MLDLAALATSLVASFLVPLFKRSAEGVASDLQERAGDAIAEKAGGLWQRVKSRLRGTPREGVAATFESDPDLVKEAVERIVKELLENDPAFRAEAVAFADEASPGDTRWHLEGDIVGAVDARGAHVAGGQVGGVVYNAAGQPSEAAATPPEGASD